ncbi:nuclear receptor binding SET domain protein isoform X2 [Stomoxys calcitrans]|uniref:Histone-lysine N-methyltransferase n=1 Tax=Stomoxys calcitrans TaxID=35570 RepID=A0A1I8PHY0_STOCA|nr:nuclear receptor binding SET domain protein isoform X2 [Stomoxys calcitrans]
MENEGDNALNDSTATVVKGRQRRIRVLHQNERDRNQENIDESFKESKISLSESNLEEEAKSSTKVEEKQTSRSSTPTTVNSSTPRRRKDPLAHLHSNLSPKYIGFVTTTTSLDNSCEEGGTRKTRRRNNISSSADTSLTKNNSDTGDNMAAQLFGTHDTSLGYVRRVPKDGNDSPEVRNSRRKEFVSPIEKLLKKNGSIVDGEMLPDDVNAKNNNKSSKEDFELIELDPKLVEETPSVDYENVEQQLETNDAVTTNEDGHFGCFENVNQRLNDDKDSSVKQSLGSDKDSNLSTFTDASNSTELLVPQYSNTIENNETLTCAIMVESQSPTNISAKESSLDIQTSVSEQLCKVSSDSNNIVNINSNIGAVSGTEPTGEHKNNADAIVMISDNNIVDDHMKNIVESDDKIEKYAYESIEGKSALETKDLSLDGNKKSKESLQIDEKDKEVDEIVQQTNHSKVDLESVDSESNADFVETVAAKSPSAVSMDSAKGSSIINDGSWMTFSTGDLFWGQIYNYCYWPCMVCPDPDGKSITTKENNMSGDHHVMVHVRFFADNARRNWVRRENLMPFTTLQQYQERLEECREKYGTKSSKFKMFVPKKKQESVWYEAVNEANAVAEVPYEERLEKFYEIFDKSKITQKNKQQRRKSMYIPTARHLSASDGESFYGSQENVNNLSIPTNAMKRERSTSPFSPAYSPIKNMTAKKRKLSADIVMVTDSEVISTSDEYTSHRDDHAAGSMQTSNSSQIVKARKSLQDLEMFNGIEFQRFYIAMKDYVLEDNTNEELDKSLVVAVRNIWALKQLSRQQMLTQLSVSPAALTAELDSVANDNVKRLSNRLRDIMLRKSLQSQRSSLDLTTDTPATSKQTKDSGAIIEKPKKVVNRPILEVVDDIFELDRRYLFKGMGRDPVCKYCYKPGGNLRRCSKNCHSWMHMECITKDFSQNGKIRKSQKRSLATPKPATDSASEEISSRHSSSTQDLSTTENIETTLTATSHVTSETEAEVICRECANNEPIKCMVCNQTDSGKLEDPLVKCTMGQCDRSFHPACCKYWPQSKITISKNHIQSFRCPSHVCHTCVSDDPKGKFQQLSNARLTKCIKCPATFHTDSTCIPAGSQILTAAHIICPRHASLKHDMTINVNWCFFCVRGGQVVCCETCPTAVHAQCLKIPIDPNEGYICEECESGRMPLYGEMVWAKFTQFRWWPAIILPPTEIPQNIARKPHNPSDFVVRFFGTHDHGWISRRRVYLYLEGDSSEPPKSKTSSLDISYNRGVEEAKQVYEIIKAKKLQQRTLNENKEKLHPQPYVRIKANRPVPPVKLHVDMDSVSKCDCDPNDENPCGPDTNCLNRVLYHECNPKVCPARDRCQNQLFESRKSPRLDVVYMKERGFGLICLEPIKAGSFVIEYVGEIINDNEFRSRMAQKSLDRDENFYFLSVEKDYIIDAGPKGNLARFMNHSCDPNCETQKWSVNSLNRVGLFAIKDIPENTELTFNYHWDDLLGNERKTCYCGSKNCSGEIGGKLKESESKESTPGVDDSNPKVAKGKSKKSKMKPIKRLPNKATIGKRKSTSKIKVNGVMHKSNKLASAAALAVTSNVPEAIADKDDDETDRETTSTNISPSPEDAIFSHLQPLRRAVYVFHMISSSILKVDFVTPLTRFVRLFMELLLFN